MTQDKRADGQRESPNRIALSASGTPASPSEPEAPRRIHTKAANTQDSVNENSNSNTELNGQSDNTNTTSSSQALKRGGYRRPAYGGPKGNGSSFTLNEEAYDKLMEKEKKYEKIGQKILDLAGVKINGTRPFDMRIHHPSVMQRVIQKGSLGLGEAYMEGLWDTTDFYSLHIFFEKILRGGIEYYFPNNAMDMANILKARLINPQTKKKSKKVGLMHYDMGNDFFEHMLGKYMQYSCGYWVTHKHESELTSEDRDKIKAQQEKNKHFDENNDGFEYGCNDETFSRAGEGASWNKMYAVPITDLEEAQVTKLRMIGEKLRLRPGMEVLDVGCGWGGLALFLAENHGVKVVGVTISEEQKKNAEAMTASYRDSITILNTDYRDIQSYYEKEKHQKDKKFDRIVSVGMFEHVGPNNYKTFFEVMRRLLNDEDDEAIMLLHTIGSKQTMESADQWYLKYIFPGGCLPAIANIGKNIENVFVVEDMHNFGYYYYLTLLAWRERFLQYWVDHKAMPENVKRRQLVGSNHRGGAKRTQQSQEQPGDSVRPNNEQGNRFSASSPEPSITSVSGQDSAQQQQSSASPVERSKAPPQQQQQTQEKDDHETFFRMFYYYLSSSAGAFKSRDLQLWQLVLSPNGVKGYPDVPRP